MMQGTIYGIVSLMTGSVVYVGQTRQRPEVRWRQHKKGRTPIAQLLQMLGAEVFEMRILETVPEPSLNEREVFWIAALGTRYPNGLNHMEGGFAAKHSVSSRRRMSEIRRDYFADPKHYAALVQRSREFWSDPEYRARWAASRAAVLSDPELRAKMSAGQREHWAGNAERRIEASERARARWADPEWKAAMRKKIRAGVIASNKCRL